MTKATLIKQEIESLVEQGKNIHSKKRSIEAGKELVRRGKRGEQLLDIANKEDDTAAKYQKWYSHALPVVQHLLPDRYTEFQEYYRFEKRKVVDAVTYTISDYLTGVTVLSFIGQEEFDSLGVFSRKFQCQIEILESSLIRIDSILSNVKAILQSELFDDELAVAEELLKKKHYRAAGAVAGVVVERHLRSILNAHSIPINKKDPTISELNDALKNDGFLDVPDWRFNQRLGDIRNLCVHSKEREPTPDEVEDLIQGAEKVIKTIF